jgi:altronate hydrolase
VSAPLEAEESVLGAILAAGSLDVEAGWRVVDSVVGTGLDVHHFYVASSGQLYAVLCSMRDRGVPVDPVEEQLPLLAETQRAPMAVGDLVVGTICGGSDGTSVVSANPAVGRAFDRLAGEGAACIFEETLEMIGCEDDLEARAVTADLGRELRAAVEKAARYSAAMGYPSFAAGNAEGGLTTIEEKSLGAYSKSGRGPVHGLLKPGDVPTRGGLFLLDVVPDGDVRWGFPNINDNQEIAELISSGCHLVLFTTGRGSVVGSALAPVVKICSNPETYARMADDMDVDAGRVLTGDASIDDVAEEILAAVRGVVAGAATASEDLGHREFVLGYKSFEPTGPACHPGYVPLPITA